VHFAKTSQALALGLLVAFSSIGCAADDEEEDVSESAEAITNGRIVVRQFGSPGPAVGKWGYDLKQDGRSKNLKPALAKEIFAENRIGMPLVRVAIRAADGHPDRGVEQIARGAYAEDIDAIKTAKEARNDLEVFASLKLLGDETFPAWVKDGGQVNANAYAVLLENYLAFMKAEGITVDWLGVDNERKYNHGGITPAKYNAIVADVTAWCKDRGVKVPGFIAPEDYGPVEDTGWLNDLWQTPAKYDRVDKIGVHIYSKHRDAAYVDAMERLSNITRGKRLWDSEFHWNDLDKDGDVLFDDIKKGMLSAFDHFDLGFQSTTWWAFQPRSRGTKASFVMSELVASTIGAQTLPTDDGDGKGVAGNKLNTRAFKTGAKEVVVWVANFGGKDRKDQWTAIENQQLASASFVQWSPTSAAKGKDGNAKVVAKNPSCFAMTFPENTITRVKVTLK
jgi:O-glycosyl hydrolase